METFYKHYITVDGCDRIVDGFSDAFRQPAETDICINEQAGYQFRLFRNGEENPTLFDGDGVPLYKWNGHKAIARNAEEIAEDKNGQNTETIAVAPRNIVSGEYVTIGGVLYLATENIPNGEPVIVGQNAVITTIEAQLHELKGE